MPHPEDAGFLGRILGHGAWKRYFAEAIAGDRLAHAYLFAGPEGLGKWIFARELARRLVCEAPPGAACGVCGPCCRAEAGTHPDLVFIDAVAAGERGLSVEVARERVVEAFRLRPHEASVRVVAVNDAERMEVAAQNALLKTLEEPPPRSLLLLCTASASAMLETVLSRCFVVRFSPVPEEELAEALRGRGLAEEDARRIARLSDGYPGRALEYSGEASELPDLARRLLRREAAAPEVWKVLQTEAEALTERSAFERRRRTALSFCALLAAEARAATEAPNPSIGAGPAPDPQDLLMRIADAASELQAHATPELVMERLFVALADAAS